MKKIVSLLSFFVLAATSYAGEYPNISIKDLQKAIADGKVAVIDVNGAKSYEKHHIPTAIHFSSSKSELSKLLPKDKNTLVVAYCGSSSCGAYKRGADEATKLGYKNVKHLSAGIKGWKSAGAELAKK